MSTDDISTKFINGFPIIRRDGGTINLVRCYEHIHGSAPSRVVEYLEAIEALRPIRSTQTAALALMTARLIETKL